MENKEQNQENQSCFFEKANKRDASQANVQKKKENKRQSKFRNE